MAGRVWREGRSRRLAPRTYRLGLVVGFGLFLAAWVGANPPGAAPDEAAHFTKAIGTATGQGIGQPTAPAATASLRDRFLSQNTRSFALPGDISPDPRWACEAFTTHSASCLDRPTHPGSNVAGGRSISLVGLYPEPSYLPMGLAARAASSPGAALYAGRAAGALLCLLLLGIAAVAFADGWLLVGLLAVTSPMVLFLAGSVTTGGIEICAGIAHAATVLALVRRSHDRRIWLAYAVSGVALALTRQFGPIWVLADLCVAAGLLGRPGLRAAVIDGGRAAVGSLTVVGLAALTTIGWDAIALPTVVPSFSVVLHQVGPAFSQCYRSVPQLFGVFGWLDTKPPGVTSDLALAVYALILVAALALGSLRQRLVLVSSLAAIVVGAVLVDAVTQLPFGFGLQARYVMPLTAMTLLLAAWVVHDRVGRRASLVPRVLSAVLVGELGVAWLANSRQAAGSAQGPRLFFQHPQWSPPGGWVPWIVVAAVAGLVMLGAICCQPADRAESPQL
ncbi:MAG: DUF2142 domain-containing protein [Actinomycetota bacterium]|nr:DUF2142 domain-containing protein [Actinomycetota bacterium]